MIRIAYRPVKLIFKKKIGRQINLGVILHFMSIITMFEDVVTLLWKH